jgi:hypothetical protein
MSYSILVGPGTGTDSNPDYTFSINVAGVGVKSTTMTPDEFKVVQAVMHRMLGLNRLNRSGASESFSDRG